MMLNIRPDPYHQVYHGPKFCASSSVHKKTNHCEDSFVPVAQKYKAHGQRSGGVQGQSFVKRSRINPQIAGE
jgi:hypothetical protein